MNIFKLACLGLLEIDPYKDWFYSVNVRHFTFLSHQLKIKMLGAILNQFIFIFVIIFPPAIYSQIPDSEGIIEAIIPLEGGGEELMAESTKDIAGILIPFNNENGKNLFREYLTRGILSCSANYVKNLHKLNKLIEAAHRDYSKCKYKMETKNELENAEQFEEQLEAISDLLGGI